MTVKTLAVKCPTCSKQVLMTDEFPFRPFCSDRCKTIDFGGWAAEQHLIEGDETESDNWSEDKPEGF
ncbi:DNA gyrase inhibitor YacG [Teredinibacter haidensis]|uniref:DNA gyrase inhibitor YacG n=1 Tax=Teredinibacter haidensis TaxID=2731755 RepID=UPI000948A4F3|nr:DNA gyrase inhibitor YacG [Teredinibacter haidensis]